MVHEDKVSKIAQFGTLTCSPVSLDSGTTMPENQGITHFSCQKEVYFYPKFLPSCGIIEIRAEKLKRLFVSNRLEKKLLKQCMVSKSKKI